MMAMLHLIIVCSAVRRDWPDAATQTFEELQSRYWSESYWRDSMWWQEANTLEAVCNYAMLVPVAKPRVAAVIGAVYDATANDTVAHCDKGVNLTFSGFFDDEAWWGADEPESPVEPGLSI